jgi:hypothetical protein
VRGNPRSQICHLPISPSQSLLHCIIDALNHTHTMARKYLGGSGESLTVWISIAASTVLVFYGYDQVSPELVQDTKQSHLP